MDVRNAEYIDIKALSEKLAIKPGTLYRMAEAGELPSYKFGRLRRFRVDDVRKWVENCKA
jgi:excisionase family DNA binding protein